MNILGLDLGIASIGWAFIQQNNENTVLKAWGSRIFEPGMEDDISSGKGISRCAERRAKHALRVLYRRRRFRKDQLIHLLTENKMLPNPLTPAFFTSIDNRLLMLFPNEIRRQTAHVLPYLYRKIALDRELTKEEFGRTIYHLAQRRGYLSNRKHDLKNEKDSGIVKSGIDKLRKDMEDAHARTLGEYFSTIDPEVIRIRGRYTDRSMYEEEFHKICAAQRHIVSEELEKELAHILFFQRKLKSCKSLVGQCRLYPYLKRCSYLHEEAQLFRIYSNVNHLRVEHNGMIRPLTESEREETVNTLNGYSPLLTQKGTMPLSKLAKAIKLSKGEHFTLSDDEKEIYGNQLHAILFRVFGDNAALLPPEKQKIFFNDLTSIEKDAVLKRRLISVWHLSEEKADETLRIPLPDEYCAYSLKALKELIPDLSAGIPLKTIENTDHPHLSAPEYDLLPVFDSDECNIDLRNPLVHRVMTELRIVVNAIITRYGKPDKIHIELARDLKSTNKERERQTLQNREREKERTSIAKRIAEEAGIENPSHNDILKVMLADECDFTCPYTGIHFSMHDLLYGKNIHIEHIIPFSRSFDDSFRNKTLCEASANLQKNNRTPFEAYSGEQYQEILMRVSHFKGPFAEAKKELFEKTEIDENFQNRNLTDTRYASKLAMQYLAMLYGGIIDRNGTQRIFAVAGGCTALIRRAWGGNYLLGEGEKVRNDHRHHAIDALTIALTTPALVKRVASMSPEERRAKKEACTPLIETALFQYAKQKLDDAAVSHHVVNKIRGSLHKDTFYSKDYGNTERHVPVKLASLTAKDLPDIVDPVIQKLIMEKLTAENDGKAISDSDMKIFNDENNLPVLKSKDGKSVNIIKTVKVRQNVKTMTVGSGDRKREVANEGNYMLAVFAKLDAAGNETEWNGDIVSLFDALQRKKAGLPLFQKEKSGMCFKFTLKKGDIVKWNKDGKELLCIIRGISLPQFSMTLIKDARMQKELKKAKTWFTPTLSSAFKGNLRKFTMNIFGELRNAND